MSWQKLFNLTVEHDFFSSAHGLRLNFQPDQTTERLLRNADLLLRADASSFSVFFESRSREILESFQKNSKNGIGFTFKVSPLDPYFSCYTDQKTEYPWYCNNPAADAAAEQLSAATDVFPADHIEPSAFMVTIKFAAESKIQPKEYSIRLKARTAYWKYYLLGWLAEKEIKITDLSGKEKFYCAGLQQPFPDISALVFYSMEAIPLRERPSQRFQLRQKGSTADKVLIKCLQNAGAENLAKEIVRGKESYVSEVYINP